MSGSVAWSRTDDVARESLMLVEAFARARQREFVAAADFINFGRSFEEAGLEEMARQAYESAIQLEPANWEAHYLLGASYSLALGRALFADHGWREIAEIAIESFRAALSLKEDYLEAITGLVECLLLDDHFAEAVGFCRRWFQLVAGDEFGECDCLFKLGLAQYFAGERSEAANCFELMLTKVEEIPEALFGLGILELDRKDPAVGQLARRLKDQDPSLADGLLKLVGLGRTLTYRDLALVLLTLEVVGGG